MTSMPPPKLPNNNNNNTHHPTDSGLLLSYTTTAQSVVRGPVVVYKLFLVYSNTKIGNKHLETFKQFDRVTYYY